MIETRSKPFFWIVACKMFFHSRSPRFVWFSFPLSLLFFAPLSHTFHYVLFSHSLAFPPLIMLEFSFCSEFFQFLVCFPFTMKTFLFNNSCLLYFLLMIDFLLDNFSCVSVYLSVCLPCWQPHASISHTTHRISLATFNNIIPIWRWIETKLVFVFAWVTSVMWLNVF